MKRPRSSYTNKHKVSKQIPSNISPFLISLSARVTDGEKEKEEYEIALGIASKTFSDQQVHGHDTNKTYVFCVSTEQKRVNLTRREFEVVFQYPFSPVSIGNYNISLVSSCCF
jgi:hypothetical protein